MTDRYNDIIDRKRPVSLKHPKMSRHDRAAQFAPFAALTGHKESIGETERVTEKKAELDESEKTELDYSLQYLLKSGRGTECSMICFEPDPFKEGGRYIAVSGQFRKTDIEKKQILLEDGRAFSLDNIYHIEVF